MMETRTYTVTPSNVKTILSCHVIILFYLLAYFALEIIRWIYLLMCLKKKEKKKE